MGKLRSSYMVCAAKYNVLAANYQLLAAMASDLDYQESTRFDKIAARSCNIHSQSILQVEGTTLTSCHDAIHHSIFAFCLQDPVRQLTPGSCNRRLGRGEPQSPHSNQPPKQGLITRMLRPRVRSRRQALERGRQLLVTQRPLLWLKRKRLW